MGTGSTLSVSPPGSADCASAFFREDQRFKQWWVWLLVIVAAASAWWAMVQQVVLDKPFGENPAPDWGVWLFFVLAGLAFPLLMGSIRLRTEVTADRVSIRYRPFVRRSIPLAEIEQATARTYHPVREYGGWGVKGWSSRNIAYNVSGSQGVQLRLKDGRRVLLGSQRTEELARIIEGQRRSAARD